ncbi:MAG TPA: CmcJ/NvfI family oxidoreductase [Pseudomonadales bacterium]|nr:CmcJ/NvfI family oxidoreductase [Pseudomonadales bacterium]
MSAYCHATMRYVPRAFTGAPEPIDVEVSIDNGREADLPGWEESGFELIHHAPNVEDFLDEVAVAEDHYAQMEALARELSGCDYALITGHIIRSPDAVKRHSDLGPITFVHSDFADTYGDLVRRRFVDVTEPAQKGLARAGIEQSVVSDARRILILQFWRNIGPAKMDMPLAFCDARTVPAASTRKMPVTDYAGGGSNFDTLGILAPLQPDEHGWYVFPEMSRNEVVAFRTYDSALAEGGRTFWTPHCAFHDPAVPLGKPARSSIELRATCVFV